MKFNQFLVSSRVSIRQIMTALGLYISNFKRFWGHFRRQIAPPPPKFFFLGGGAGGGGCQTAAPKLCFKSCFAHYSCVIIIFFNMGLCGSVFSTYSFGTLGFRLSLLSTFSFCSVFLIRCNLYRIYKICVIIIYIGARWFFSRFMEARLIKTICKKLIV